MNRRLAFVGLAVGLLAIPSLGAEPDFAALEVQRYDPPKPAPTFALPDLQGKTVRLRDLRGKVVLLYFQRPAWIGGFATHHVGGLSDR